MKTEAEMTPDEAENRGMAWVIGAFLICPCHLPLTLWLAATLLSGTVVGALLHAHPYVAGAILSAVWLVATWHGLRLIRTAEKGCALPTARPSSGRTAS